MLVHKKHSSAKQRKERGNTERLGRVLDGHRDSGYEGRPSLFGGFPNFTNNFLTVRVLRPSQKHCHFSYRLSTHTQTRKHARAHTRAREGEKEKRSLSRSRDNAIVAVRTKRTSSRSQSLLATSRRGR